MLQGNGSAWEETRGRLAKRGGKQCYKQAGNQRELVRPREPGSLAWNETAFSLAGKWEARQTCSRGRDPGTSWLAERRMPAVGGGRLTCSSRHRPTGEGHGGKQAKPEAELCMRRNMLEIKLYKVRRCMYPSCVFSATLIFVFKSTVVSVHISGQLAANHHKELPMLDIQVISCQGEDVICTSSIGNS
jgi:hypothetical protein